MSVTVTGTEAAIEQVQVAAYHVPTDAPEADGTLSWDHTTLVTVELSGAVLAGKLLVKPARGLCTSRAITFEIRLPPVEFPYPRP